MVCFVVVSLIMLRHVSIAGRQGAGLNQCRNKDSCRILVGGDVILLNMSDTDLELLARYTRQHAEDAFAELVRRHVNLVHSAALRQVRSPQLAEEVSQSTFVKLARRASEFAPNTILSAWLYQVTRREAIDVVRREARRKSREQIVTEMNAMNATTADWTHIEPLLDEAMSALDETDRSAVLLRYFENKSLREVGAALGTSDDAAQKRVRRAVERLRELFAKRGITVGASGLVVAISANAVQAAPAGLAVTISTAAPLTGKTIAATTKVIAMTTLQKALVTTALVAAVGVGIYEARQASQWRGQVQTLVQQQAPLTEQILQLQQERDATTNQLASLIDEISKSKGNNAELLKLRGEVGTLRSQLLARTQELKDLSANGSNALAGITIPSGDEYNVRQFTLTFAIQSLVNAAVIFSRNNNGQRATNFDQLSGYLGWFKINAPGGDIGLDSFELVSGRSGDRKRDVLIRERIPHRIPSGKWERFYGLSDGSMNVFGSDDGNFDVLEQQQQIVPVTPP